MKVTDPAVRVTADMAFLMDPAPPEALDEWLRSCGADPYERYLLLAPRPWPEAKRHAEDFVAAAKEAYERHGLRPLVFAMEPDRDREFCTRIAQRLADVRALMLEAPKDASLSLGLMRRVKAVLGMRLHSLIFAASQGTPFAGVAYDPKVSGFFDYLGQDNFCTLSECTSARLTALLEAALAEGAQFAARARSLRTLAEQNCQIAAALLKTPD